MVALMKVLARLLGPDVPDEGALYAGVLVLAVIFKLGGHLPPEELRNLFVAVIRRLHYSAHPGLIIRLLLVIANMIHSNEERSVEVLKSVELEGYPRSEKDMPPTDRKISGLESTLRVWVAFQKFTFGKVDKAVTCLALAKLLNNPAVVGAMKGVEVPTHDDGDPSVGTGRQCMLWSPTPIPLRGTDPQHRGLFQLKWVGSCFVSWCCSEKMRKMRPSAHATHHLPVIGGSAFADADDYAALSDFVGTAKSPFYDVEDDSDDEEEDGKGRIAEEMASTLARIHPMKDINAE
ncbi:unnamed protein product, partial [Symbiodinium sp. KB8]